MLKSLLSIILSVILLRVEASKTSLRGIPRLGTERNVLFEEHRAPSNFQKLQEPTHEGHNITLHIGLKNRRFEDSIDDLLERMSDRSHARFRTHLTDEEFAELNRPDDESIQAVFGWLQSHGFQRENMEWTPHQDWVKVHRVPVRKVEMMLDTTYSIYRSEDGDHILRTEKYSLPKSLHHHIDLIQPTTMFGRLQTQRSVVHGIKNLSSLKAEVLQDVNTSHTCSDPRSVTNYCLRQLYKTDSYQPRVPQFNAIGIAGYLGEVANFRDAQMYLKAQRPDQMGGSFTMMTVNRGSRKQKLTQDEKDRQVGLEANLDSQTALGFTLPTQNIYYSVGGRPPFTPDRTTPRNTNEPYLDWLNYMINQPQDGIPKVISTSYGDNEQTVPPSYARRVCQGFGYLGARGVSVIFSSGDAGVGRTGFCHTNDKESRATFLPMFPASCPYVTSVGATENFFPEVAVSQDGPGGFTSGGGFSNYFPTPKWQQEAVNRYLNFLGPDTYKGLYNRTGRGFPDVSAQGAQYVIAWQKQFLTVGGTSASAPTFASIITLLNDYLISQGGSSMGYLNPWLYNVGFRGLNDILSGSSAGCNTTGFTATRGWDPVTGLGTPNFPKLQELVSPGF